MERGHQCAALSCILIVNFLPEEPIQAWLKQNSDLQKVKYANSVVFPTRALHVASKTDSVASAFSRPS